MITERSCICRSRFLLAVLVIPLLICTGITGCGSTDSEATTPSPTAAAPVGADMPELPALPPRSTSATPGRILLGDEYEPAAPYTSNQVAAGVDTAEFTPDYVPGDLAHGTLAWAMYHFDLTGLGTPEPKLRYGFATPPGDYEDVWLGLADWEHNRWCWYGSEPHGTTSVTGQELERFISQDSQAVIVLVVIGQAPVQLQWLAIGGNLPPSADFSVTPPAPETGVEVAFDFTPSVDLDGDVVNYEFDFGEGDGFTDLGAATAAQHTYAAEGTYPVALRVTDDGGLTDTKALPLVVGNPMHGVIAYLDALPTSGAVPLTVLFDAGASLPSTGEDISEYRFDFDGDGEDDQAGSDPTGSFLFLWPGTYAASVTVVDTALESDTATVQLELSDNRTWQLVRNVSAGQTFALFEVDGRAAVAYENNYGEVVYTRANNAAASTWPEPVLIDIASDVRGFGDGCTVFGHPAFAYYSKDAGENNLRLHYAYSATLDGMNDGSWGIEPVATCGYISLQNAWVSLADLANSPGLLYYTSSPDQLVFRRAHDYTGGTWADPVVVADEQVSNQPCSLALVDGNPAGAYCCHKDSVNYGVYYRRATNAAGTAWGSEEGVLPTDSTYNYGMKGVDLHQYGDLLAITSQVINSGRLRYCRHDPLNPGAWISIGVNDQGNTAGNYPAWAMLGGYPVIASGRGSGRAVEFRRSDDEYGSAWNGAPQVIEDTSSTGHEIGLHTQLVVINNTPIVAYYDESDQELCVASLY